jgi:hypothetical protein
LAAGFADHELTGVEEKRYSDRNPSYGKATNKRILSLPEKPPGLARIRQITVATWILATAA